MAYRRYRSSADADWGELFGLTPADLTDKQLKKISFRKLIELAGQDPRVEQIVGNKILKARREDLEHLSRLEDDEIKLLPHLLSSYNKCLRERGTILDKQKSKSYYNRRDDYVFWKWLNNSNKAKEFSRWMDSESSIIDTNQIDYSWLYTTYPWLADKVTEHILTKYKSSATRLVINLPEVPTKKYVNRILECDRSVYIHLLSNKFTPREHIIKCLREIAGRVRVPALNVELDKSMLLELPSVMRLKLLESLLIHMRSGHVKFSDIDNEDDLKPLLFGTAIKYNARVEYVVRRFRFLCK